MNIGPYRLRPALIPTLAVTVLLPVLFALGLWQLQRADQKRDLVDQLQERRAMPVLDAANLQADLQQRFRRVAVMGEYIRDHDVLLDNQIRDGVAGYTQLSPLRLAGGQGVLLVNRGWLAVGSDRRWWPVTRVPIGLLRQEGILDRPARPGLQLGDSIVVADGWPLVLLEFDALEVEQHLGEPVLPLVLVAADQALPVALPGFGPQRHLGYALQWFSLAFALLVIFVVVNTSRLERG